MIRLLAVALLVCSCPAQNLLRWDGWQTVNPQRVGALKITQSSIGWMPIAGKGGIAQTVIVPKAGTYLLDWRGSNVATGIMQYHISIAGIDASKAVFSDLHVSRVVRLVRDQVVTVTFTSFGVANPFSVDRWLLDQPSLEPVVGPAVEMEYSFDAMQAEVWLGSPAGSVLAMSGGLLSTPIRIPGFAHGLELDPTGLVILAVAPSGGIKFYGSVFSNQMKWPVYFQALNASSFGPSIKL